MRNGIAAVLGVSLLTSCVHPGTFRWEDRDRETFFAHGISLEYVGEHKPDRTVHYADGFIKTIRVGYSFKRDGEAVRDFSMSTQLLDSEGFVVENSLVFDEDADGDFDEYTLVSRFSAEIFSGFPIPIEVFVQGNVASDSDILYDGFLRVLDKSSGQRIGSADISSGVLENEQDYVFELGIPQEGYKVGMSLSEQD